MQRVFFNELYLFVCLFIYIYALILSCSCMFTCPAAHRCTNISLFPVRQSSAVQELSRSVQVPNLKRNKLGIRI